MINMIILALSTLSAFLLGAYITYRSMTHQSMLPERDNQPEPFSPHWTVQKVQGKKFTRKNDLGEIISPYEEEQKARTVKVKI